MEAVSDDGNNNVAVGQVLIYNTSVLDLLANSLMVRMQLVILAIGVLGLVACPASSPVEDG